MKPSFRIYFLPCHRLLLICLAISSSQAAAADSQRVIQEMAGANEYAAAELEEVSVHETHALGKTLTATRTGAGSRSRKQQEEGESNRWSSISTTRNSKSTESRFNSSLGPSFYSKTARAQAASAKKHLDEASSSIPNNIAEGNGKWSKKDRQKFLEVARGSALECASGLDILVALAPHQYRSRHRRKGKTSQHREPVDEDDQESVRGFVVTRAGSLNSYLLLLLLLLLHECRMSDSNSRPRFFTPALRPQIHRFFLGLARSHPLRHWEMDIRLRTQSRETKHLRSMLLDR